MTARSGGGREGIAVIAETCGFAIALGVLMGLVWWLVSPTERWTVVDGGLVPADVGFDAWFAADGWFAVLGVAAGVALAVIGWRRGRRDAVAFVVGIIVGAALLAATAWALGGVLGPVEVQTAAATAEIGSTVEGALGVRALGVLFAPALAALSVTAMLLAGAAVEEEASPAVPPMDSGWVPQRPEVAGPS